MSSSGAISHDSTDPASAETEETAPVWPATDTGFPRTLLSELETPEAEAARVPAEPLIQPAPLTGGETEAQGHTAGFTLASSLQLSSHYIALKSYLKNAVFTFLVSLLRSIYSTCVLKLKSG